MWREWGKQLICISDDERDAADGQGSARWGLATRWWDETTLDAELNKLSYLDFKGLHKACAKLTVKSKDKMLNVVFWGCITAMLGVINLYMSFELSYTWWEASLVVLKSQGQGPNHAQNIHTWIHCYLHHQKLPLHCYGTFSSSILNDEDFAQEIPLYLLKVAKNRYVHAQDVVDFVSQPEVQESLSVKKRTISLKTAQW